MAGRDFHSGKSVPDTERLNVWDSLRSYVSWTGLKSILSRLSSSAKSPAQSPSVMGMPVILTSLTSASPYTLVCREKLEKTLSGMKWDISYSHTAPNGGYIYSVTGWYEVGAE